MLPENFLRTQKELLNYKAVSIVHIMSECVCVCVRVCVCVCVYCVYVCVCVCVCVCVSTVLP